MRNETIDINGNTIWLTIDQIRVFNEDMNLIETKNEFICFFKLTETTQFYGELLRDENNVVLVFKSPDQAIQYTKTVFNRNNPIL